MTKLISSAVFFAALATFVYFFAVLPAGSIVNHLIKTPGLGSDMLALLTSVVILGMLFGVRIKISVPWLKRAESPPNPS